MIDVQRDDRSVNVLPLNKQEAIRDQWLKIRLDSILKEAMQQAEIPMWVVISKEYNEDPVVDSLTPCEHDSSRRLSIFVFIYDEETESVERYLIGSPHPALSGLYEMIWNRQEGTQWERLRSLIEEKKPARIGINKSSHIAVADGLTHSLYETLQEEIGAEWAKKLVSAEQLVIHWFLKRSEEEMITYPFLADLTSNLARKALSNEVIYPGITSTKDVVDWIRQKVVDLGVKTSFYPTIDLQRRGSEVDRLSGVTIQPGDIVHLDFGLEYLGLATDTQQLAYVLKQGETSAPQGLLDAFEQALLMEDIVMSKLKPGMSGNDVFEQSIAEAKNKSIQAMLYSHPIGPHCHEAGPTIGLFDQQKRIPFKGDIKVVSRSAYALEFNIRSYIPEWGEETYIYLEQPVAVYENKADYLTPRQETFYLIR